MTRKYTTIPSLLALLLAFTVAAQAVEVIWTGNDADPGNVNFSSADNWTVTEVGPTVPANNDHLFFVSGSTPKNVINNDLNLDANGGLTVINDGGGNHVGLFISGQDYTINGNPLTLGNSGTGFRMSTNATINAPLYATVGSTGYCLMYIIGNENTLTIAGGLQSDGRIDMNGFETGVNNFLVFDGGTVTAPYLNLRRGDVTFTGGCEATFSDGNSIRYAGDSTSGAVRNVTINGAGTVVTAANRILLNNWNGDPGDITISNGAVYASNSGFVAGTTPGTHYITLDNGTMRANASAEFLPDDRGFVVDILAGGMTADSNGNSMTMSSVLSGVGGLTKVGAGSAILMGANTYTGNTTINEGTLSIANAYLDDAADVSIDYTVGGGIFDLAFAGVDTIAKLFVDGVSLATGTYDNTYDFITGTGALLVTAQDAPSVLLGDANNDGVVSADDFAAVQTNFGNTGAADGLLPGDANDDGVVSADDFAAIQTNFGNVLGAAAEAAPVPEPATMALLAIGGVALLRRKK